MWIDIVTLFPEMLDGFLHSSMMARAQQNQGVVLKTHQLRDYSEDRAHLTVDDRPFGGGPGMVLRPEPLVNAIENLRKPTSKIIYLCPDGELLTDAIAQELSKAEHLVLLSGHYEGIDQRVRDTFIDREISIGDYVLTNGTLPAAVLVDAVVRQIPGVLGEEKSLTYDSFRHNLLSFPQYTRPAVFRGEGVPEVLLSGNHAAIEAWRFEQRKQKTAERRPDLLLHSL